MFDSFCGPLSQKAKSLKYKATRKSHCLVAERFVMQIPGVLSVDSPVKLTTTQQPHVPETPNIHSTIPQSPTIKYVAQQLPTTFKSQAIMETFPSTNQTTNTSKRIFPPPINKDHRLNNTNVKFTRPLTTVQPKDGKTSNGQLPNNSNKEKESIKTVQQSGFNFTKTMMNLTPQPPTIKSATTSKSQAILENFNSTNQTNPPKRIFPPPINKDHHLNSTNIKFTRPLTTVQPKDGKTPNGQLPNNSNKEKESIKTVQQSGFNFTKTMMNLTPSHPPLNQLPPPNPKLS
ncbi:unnamed protein product [Orchesella dallaii]|uniref:Uncharacterized protein n=1 Tax=Orchesella dallaii TaxID=48710 RepID=A0ABP1S4J5_9HEXA